jgi:hypothetical protein
MVIRKRRTEARAWCAECSALVEMFTTAEAAVALGLRERILFREIEGGRIHFTETDEDPLLICANSLHHLH